MVQRYNLTCKSSAHKTRIKYRFEKNEKSREDFSTEHLSLKTIFHRYGIECRHAYNVSRNALELFDILDSIHWLDPKRESL